MKRSFLLIALAFAGCAQYATVSKREPQFRPLRDTVGALGAVEQDIAGALKREKRDPLVAIGEFLTAADVASQQFVVNPSDTAARDAYNFAVARVLGVIQQAKLDPWNQPLRVPASGGEFIVTRRPDPRPQWNPALYEFTPADEFDIKGTYVAERERKEGIGAPTVAISRAKNASAAKDFAMQKSFYGVTVVVRFEGRRAVFAFEDPLATENVNFGGRSVPLCGRSPCWFLTPSSSGWASPQVHRKRKSLPR